jgi:DNA polymerase III alpha subunit
MLSDKFSNPIFEERDIFDALYNGQPLSPDMFVSSNDNTRQLEEQLGFLFLKPYPNDFDVSIEEHDLALQSDWNMPEEYKTFDIKNWILSQCPNIAEYNRAEEELTEFERRNMLDLLRWLKYFVEFSRKNNILWGVGRGSSVSSYVLYLIGVHKIDPIKYNLDWQDFLR